MIEIDGSYGEGGGQVLRTAAGFSAITQEGFKIENIRAGREKPGLRPQHINAVKAVAKICAAEVSGLAVGSSSLTFKPGKLRGGSYRIDVGTAGSITLVLQAVMLPAMRCEKDVVLRIRGGTDVRWSPPIDYLRFVALPILERAGYRAELRLVERGYYPAGGGEVEARICKAELERIELEKRGDILDIMGLSHASGQLREAEVAGRQKKAAKKLIGKELGLVEKLEIEEEYRNTESIGSGITLYARTENSVLGASDIGERGRMSEEVGRCAAKKLIEEIDSGACLDEHMADQIIPYLAIAGGGAKASSITGHAKTNAYVSGLFGYDVRIKEDTIKA